MAITGDDALLNAIGNNTQKIAYIKTAQTAGVNTETNSLWRVDGVTPPGAIPTSAVTCNNTTPGSALWTNPTGGLSTHVVKATMVGYGYLGYELHDRLAHMGGLSGTVTTAQTVNLDLNALGSTDNISQRKVRSDFASVQWWLEWYTATGTTTRNATITYTDGITGVTGQTTTVSITSSTPANRMRQIIPAYNTTIRSIQSVTLAASTGTAGNFGVTATVQRTEFPLIGTTSTGQIYDFAQTGCVVIYDSSCLFLVASPGLSTIPPSICYITLAQG